MDKVMEEVHLTTIKPRNNVLLLAQEISFAKVLSCNDKRLRDRGVKRLKRWFMARSQSSLDFTRDDHLRIWKGLFYCMWMSDKPLIQEELAEEISSLVHSFASFKASLLFVETFFASLAIEWFGIDQLRLDKFMMLVRRFMRQSFELVARLNWSTSEVQQLADVYQKTLTTGPMGLSMHMIEVFCEELAKVGKGELSNETILQFVSLFANVMASLKDGRLISQITRCVFLHLIRQTELGIEHHMKFSAWKEYGFPGGDVDTAERIEVDSESENEEAEEAKEDLEDDYEEEEIEVREEGVDARAGKVDVLLPPLDFEPQGVLKVLTELRNKKDTSTKARKTLIQLISKFEKLILGKYPLGLHKVELPSKVDKRKEIDKVAKRLYIEERQMIQDGDNPEEIPLPKNKKLKKRELKKRQLEWNVSDTNDSATIAEENSETSCNSSWEVSESTLDKTDESSDSKKCNKRKLEENSLAASTSIKPKKTKMSPFLVSNSKENSFSSPVASTPKKIGNQSALEKSKQNVKSCQENVLGNTNKITVKSKKLKKKKSDSNQPNKSTLAINNTDNSFQTKENSNSNASKLTELQLNVSSESKNNGWGGEWDEPTGDVEYEIFIPNKKYVEKRKSLGMTYPKSSIIHRSAEKTPVGKLKKDLDRSTPGSQKRVEFNLSANKSQEYKEYAKSMKKSNQQVLFDANKKPKHGLLKNSTPSPINPFYQNKLKLNIPKLIL